MKALDRARRRYTDALILRKLAPKGYRMVAQAKLELAAKELLKREVRKR